MKPVTHPPIRRLFRPDPGFLLWEADLKRADAQAVARESNDEQLLADFRNNVDIYTENAAWVYQLPLEKVTHHQYFCNKAAVHAVDYGAKERTLAGTLETTEDRARQFIYDWWFKKHPGILQWQQNVERQVRRTRTIRNVWGFRKIYTARPDGLLPQALAWIASSTVSVTINKAMLRIYNELPAVQILLQIHDSLLGQVRIEDAERLLPEVMERMNVEIPYKPTPLVIPATLKVSETSWGDLVPWKN